MPKNACFHSADGIKQQKVANGTTTQYAGSYIYENSSLKFINHPEGYIEPDGAGGYDYVYQYKDHLGNIRLSYTDTNGDGVVDVNEIVSEKNYYPFGLTHQGYNGQTQGIYHPYGYNGKEEQVELDLEWLDFEARNYDAALGRWMNIDPLAENSRRWSPYNYAYNNPVYFIDPDGMQATDWYENAEGQIVFDENINSQEDLDAAGIEGEYIDDSFVAKDQNSDIFIFNEDGTVTDSDATVSTMEAGGVDTSDMIEVESTMVDDGKNDVTEAAVGAAVFIVADDATVVGTADDILLPVVGLVAGIAALAETDAKYEFASHRKRRGSKKKTNDKHTKPRPGRSNTKQRQKPNWKPNPNKKNQIIPIISILDEDY